MKKRQHATGRRSRLRRLLRLAGYTVLGWVAVTWLLVLIMRFVPPFTSAVMVERQVSAWVHGDRSYQTHYHWVSWSHMSKLAPLAMVAGEDQHFPFHHGFDFGAIHKAIRSAENGGRLRGASTISQQTAKNLFLWTGRSWVRKGLEAYFTVLLEITWPKRRILAVYANIAELGDGIYGVGAASRLYFGTDAAHLSKRQAALLAAVLPNPREWHANHPSAYINRRAAWIEQQMRQLGGTRYITDDNPPRPE